MKIRRKQSDCCWFEKRLPDDSKKHVTCLEKCKFVDIPVSFDLFRGTSHGACGGDALRYGVTKLSLPSTPDSLPPPLEGRWMEIREGEGIER